MSHDDALLAALEALPAPPEVRRLAAALAAILSGRQGISELTPDEIQRVDATAVSRQNYVLSLLRLSEYLLTDPQGSKAAGEQAKVSMEYIRHVETSKLGALRLGRTAADESLADEITRLRAEVSDVAKRRAQVLSELAANGKTTPN